MNLSIPFPLGWLLNKKAARVEVDISLAFLHWVGIALHPWPFVSNIAIFVLKGDVKGGFTRAGQAMTSCHLQCYYSCTLALHGGPVVLRPVRATPCCLMDWLIDWLVDWLIDLYIVCYWWRMILIPQSNGMHLTSGWDVDDWVRSDNLAIPIVVVQ